MNIDIKYHFPLVPAGDLFKDWGWISKSMYTQIPQLVFQVHQFHIPRFNQLWTMYCHLGLPESWICRMNYTYLGKKRIITDQHSANCVFQKLTVSCSSQKEFILKGKGLTSSINLLKIYVYTYLYVFFVS